MPSQDIPNDPNKTVLQQMNEDIVGVVWDRNEEKSIKGLHLRIFASGKRCFYFFYTTKHGLRRRPKIGEGISLTEARKIAAEMRLQVSMGIDPSLNNSLKRKELTIQQAFDNILKDFWSKDRYIASGRNREVQNIYNSKIKAAFGKRKLSDIRSLELRTWHNAMSATPAMANRALEVLGKIFSYSIDQEWCSENPTIRVEAYTERKRKRVPQSDEVQCILKSLFGIASEPSDPDRFAAIAAIALFYTGARPKMLADAFWVDVIPSNFNDLGIAISLRGKMTEMFGENEKLFIPTTVVKLLELYPRHENGKMFEVTRLRTLWLRIRDLHDLKNLWLRDTRKAFASMAMKKGVSMELIGDALNHKSMQTTLRYAQELDESNAQTTSIVAQSFDDLL